MREFVQSWEFLGSNKTFQNMPVIEGLLTSLQSLRYLAKDLFEDVEFQWFSTRRVTQDHLEVNLVKCYQIE
jgi:hypothetical protein